MSVGDRHMAKTLGADLRALRKAKGLTLAELSAHSGRSVGWHSQVERDLSVPGIPDLDVLARVFEVPLSLFFGDTPAPPEEQGLIVRAGARRSIGERETGHLEELLSPDLTDSFEVIHSTFLPGSVLQKVKRRATQEVVYMVSGRLDIAIDGRGFAVAAGDTFRVRGEDFHWANPYPDPAMAIWVISPPVY